MTAATDPLAVLRAQVGEDRLAALWAEIDGDTTPSELFDARRPEGGSMKFRLPEEFNSAELEAATDEGHVVGFRVGGYIIRIPRELLMPLSHPLPEEPPVGTLVHLASYFGIYERLDRGWLSASATGGQALAWETLVRLNSGAAPIRLVPDPFAEPVELPWREDDQDDEGWREVALSGPYAGMVYAYIEGRCNLSPANARAFGRALMAAADAAERAS